MVVFDANFLVRLLNPRMDEISPISDSPVHEKINYLVETLAKERQAIGIPTPALAEVLVHEHLQLEELLKEIGRYRNLKILPFDQRACIELAIMNRQAEDKRGGLPKSEPWQKIKVDRQIVAVARVASVSLLYSNDTSIKHFAQQAGLTVIATTDLSVPPPPEAPPVQKLSTPQLTLALRSPLSPSDRSPQS